MHHSDATSNKTGPDLPSNTDQSDTKIGTPLNPIDMTKNLESKSLAGPPTKASTRRIPDKTTHNTRTLLPSNDSFAHHAGHAGSHLKLPIANDPTIPAFPIPNTTGPVVSIAFNTIMISLKTQHEDIVKYVNIDTHPYVHTSFARLQERMGRIVRDKAIQAVRLTMRLA